MTIVALATCNAFPELTPSDTAYAEALNARGVQTRDAPWQAGVEPFRGSDLVVIRSAWDYHRDVAAYRDWLDGLESTGLRVANPLPLVRWNLDKSYLDDLAAAGIPTPGQRTVPRDLAAVRSALAGSSWPQAVLKPSVGASGHGVELVSTDTLDRQWPGLEAATAPHRIVLQAFVPEIREHGQVSYVFLGGRFSHAVRFVPAGGDFRINSRFEPTRERIEAQAEEIAAAARVVAALPVPPLYARIDMVQQGDRLLLLEAEVNEPGLLFQYVPEAASEFARATVEWLHHGDHRPTAS